MQTPDPGSSDAGSDQAEEIDVRATPAFRGDDELEREPSDLELPTPQAILTVALHKVTVDDALYYRNPEG